MDQLTQDTQTRDDKGRIVVSELTDRELLEEIALGFRFVGDAFLQMQDSPMFANIMRMFGNGNRR